MTADRHSALLAVLHHRDCRLSHMSKCSLQRFTEMHISTDAEELSCAEDIICYFGPPLQSCYQKIKLLQDSGNLGRLSQLAYDNP